MRGMQLIIEPDDGAMPVLNAIRHAKKAIDLTIFRLDDDDVTAALDAAVKRGVHLRALIAFANRGGSKGLRTLEWELLAAGVTVARTSDALARYHAKFMIVDGRELHVCAFNYTRSDLKSRSFGIITTSARLVKQASKLFEADLAHQAYDGGNDGLVVSPENARDRIEEFLRDAKHELLIYDTRLTDARILRILDERARSGVGVRVIGHIGKHADLPAAKLHHCRLHLRAIVRDASAAFIGSQSLRKPELDGRREVGVFVHDPGAVRKIADTFAFDWPVDDGPVSSAVERAGLPLASRDVA